ncbi:cyclin-dependent kinase inhibitor 5-like [Cornus florida]|uniref:cyclin-dependent kinase inhibitor 5-like n=1 Tax=Cornus florida TaxID=4283 RepID=UPI00289CC028|nr:cyclin-dependent kinase inhibitor 5-like [Cornus florida]
MGKYMRKAKMTTDVAVMEVSQSSLGVRTRAKTLALQRLQSTTTPPPNPESSYLELRSRRLEKPPLINKTTDKNQRQQSAQESWKENPKSDYLSKPRVSSRLRLSSVNSGSVGSVSVTCSKKEDGFCKEHETEENNDWGIEASFGENNLDFEGRERSTRESTPCSLMRDSDTIGTPGSTTRPKSSSTVNRRNRDALQRNIPTTREIEDFFAFAEQQHQRLFSEKYNFDFVNDSPLPGRYEWVRVDL